MPWWSPVGSGWSAAGLRLLESGSGPGCSSTRIAGPTRPHPLGPELARLGASSLIDVSDGLAADLGHVCEASRVGIDLDLAALRRLGTAGVADDELWSGGEDHALAGTVPASLVEQLPPGVVVVGRVVDGPPEVRVDGAVVRGGWDHYSSGLNRMTAPPPRVLDHRGLRLRRRRRHPGRPEDDARAAACTACRALTAVTAQNSLGVSGVWELPLERSARSSLRSSTTSASTR